MLKPDPLPPIPAETARAIRTILPNGNIITRPRDEFGPTYSNADFAKLYSSPNRSSSLTIAMPVCG